MSTCNQKQVFNKIVENVRKGGKVNVGRAMLESGYSESTSKHPEKLLNSKGWGDLTEKYLPDKLLFERVYELINGNEWRERAAGLDMALRIKGRYKLAELTTVINNINSMQTNKVEPISDEKFDEIMMSYAEKNRLKILEKEELEK